MKCARSWCKAEATHVRLPKDGVEGFPLEEVCQEHLVAWRAYRLIGEAEEAPTKKRASKKPARKQSNDVFEDEVI